MKWKGWLETFLIFIYLFVINHFVVDYFRWLPLDSFSNFLLLIILMVILSIPLYLMQRVIEKKKKK